MIKLDIPNPHSKSEILASLRDVSNKVKDYYTSISPELFFHDGLGGWSPAQNLSHITFIASLAANLFKLPRFLLVLFGKQDHQRDFKTLHDDYLGSDKFIYIGPLAPSTIQPPSNAKEVIHKMASDWIKSSEEIISALQSVPEEDFDNYSIPHPSMGMLSYREMVYVLIIHPIHHTYKVEQKLPN